MVNRATKINNNDRTKSRKQRNLIRFRINLRICVQFASDFDRAKDYKCSLVKRFPSQRSLRNYMRYCDVRWNCSHLIYFVVRFISFHSSHFCLGSISFSSSIFGQKKIQKSWFFIDTIAITIFTSSIKSTDHT